MNADFGQVVAVVGLLVTVVTVIVTIGKAIADRSDPKHLDGIEKALDLRDRLKALPPPQPAAEAPKGTPGTRNGWETEQKSLEVYVRATSARLGDQWWRHNLFYLGIVLVPMGVFAGFAAGIVPLLRFGWWFGLTASLFGIGCGLIAFVWHRNKPKDDLGGGDGGGPARGEKTSPAGGEDAPRGLEGLPTAAVDDQAR